MKVSTKLNIAFSLAAAFLLVVDVLLIVMVRRVDRVFTELNRTNRQADAVLELMHSYRVTPQRTGDQLARLSDLQTWARDSRETELIGLLKADLQTPTHTGGPVFDKLEQLLADYRTKDEQLRARLNKIHNYMTYGLLLIIVDSIVLFLVLIRLIRNWLLMPLQMLANALTGIVAGDRQRRVSPIGDDEFRQIGSDVNKLADEVVAVQEREKANERLLHVGSACSHVTHNVRSLLGSIRSLAQQESRATDVDPNARVGFNYIIALVNKLDQWVRDMHSSLSPTNPRRAAHHVEPVIHDSIALLEPKVSEKSIAIDYQASDNLPRVLIDRALFEQAFLAVLTNAVEATPDAGQVGVYLRRSRADFLTIVIEDQGPGMTDETRQRVFEPYFTTKRDSAGLGLTIAHSIVKSHDGEIEIDTNPGKGTRISMSFPAAK